MNSMHKGTFVAPSSITVGQWAIEWLTTYKKGIVIQSTYEHYFYLAKHLVEKILKSCHDHPVLKNRYPDVLLAATTGLRLGEFLGLRWCDLNLATNEIQVLKSLTQTKALGLVLGPLKTKASIRKIKITQEVIEVLKQLKSNTIDIDIKQEKLCFVTRNDTPILPRTFERSWADILRIAKVPYKNIHVLRHTHATELLAAGVPIIEVSRRLGHSKIAIPWNSMDMPYLIMMIV